MLKKVMVSILTIIIMFVTTFANAEKFEPLSKGAGGELVVQLQRKLEALGYIITDEEGQFGIGTKNTLFIYQMEHGLTPSGDFDEETYHSLFPNGLDEDSASRSTSNYHEDPYPGEIVTAKSRLWLLGYDCGNTNKEEDDTFASILQDFQKDHGIEITGKCDYATRVAIKESVDSIHYYPILGENDEGKIRLGMMNKVGQLIVPPKYSEYEVCEGIVLLEFLYENEYGNLYGKTDAYYVSGEKIQLPDNIGISTVRGYIDGVLIYYDNNVGLCGILNTKGEIIAPAQWKFWGSHYRDGFIRAQDANLYYGIIDASGDIIVPFRYKEDSLEVIGSGWYRETTADGMYYCYVYDKNLKFHTTDTNTYEAVFHDGILKVVDGTRIFYINENGDIVDGDNTKSDGDKDSGIKSDRDDGKYILLDEQGVRIFPDVWSDKPIKFSSGLARVIQNGKEGFIDTKGEFVIPMVWDHSPLYEWSKIDTDSISEPAYSTIGMQIQKGFEGDLALVCSGERLFYINLEGEIVSYAGPSSVGKASNPIQKTESNCEAIAQQYLKDHLKNPSSLQVHNVSSRKSDDEYLITIDYSAMNSFGGYTRSTFICTVNSLTGIVTAAMNN